MKEPEEFNKPHGQASSQHDGLHTDIPLYGQNPELLKIYADNQSKKQQIIHWGVFFTVTLITFIVVNFLPEPVNHIEQTSNFCTNPVDVDNTTGQVTCSPFNLYQNSSKGLAVRHLITLNQFIVLNAYFYLKNTEIDLDYKTKANLTVYELRKEGDKHIAKFIANKSVEYSLTTGKSTKFFNDQGVNKKIIQKFEGFFVELIYIRKILHKNYLFIVEFPTQADAVSNLDNIKIQASVINSSFSVFSIVLRAVFFGVSVTGFSIFVRNLRRVPRKSFVLEQKFAFLLGLELMFFNDPFYAITITIPNDASNFFSVLWVVATVCTLLFFWVCALERIDKQNGQIKSKVMTKPKWIVFGLGCLSVLGYYLYFSYKHNSDPFVDLSELSSGLFYCLLISSVLVVGFAFLKIISSFINICKEYESKIWRNKLLTNFSIFFVFCVFVFLFSNGFDVFSLLPNRILIIFVQMNMYILYLMFMYSPTKDANQLQLGYYGFGQETHLDQDVRTIVEVSMIGKEDEIELDEEYVEQPNRGFANLEEEGEQEDRPVATGFHHNIDSKSLIQTSSHAEQVVKRYSLAPEKSSDFSRSNDTEGIPQEHIIDKDIKDRFSLEEPELQPQASDPKKEEAEKPIQMSEEW